MIIIIFLGGKMGMMFNHRRQSRDEAVTRRIQEICRGGRLWMNLYSEKLYGSLEGMDIMVEDDFLSMAGGGEYCLVETERLAQYEEKIEKIVVFWWNRTYPADCHLDLDLSRWESVEQNEFAGASHEKITEEIYERKICL